MGYVEVLPEFGLVADPVIGLVTSAGESLAPVIERVNELDKIADDMVGMLSGEGSFLASFPNREGVLKYAGMVTSMWYGLAVGLLIGGVIVLGLI